MLKWAAAFGATTASLWVAFLVAGVDAASWLAVRFGGNLARLADGKFDDPVRFVEERLREGLLLATAAALLWLTGAALGLALSRNARFAAQRGLAMGVAVFALINAFAWCCGKTVLFWSLFYSKTAVDNFAQYEIKGILLDEAGGKRRAILIGNSQTNTNIDEVRMNRSLGDTLWTTELTQPGARSFDLLSLTREMPLREGDLMICYLSEIMFFGGVRGTVSADFLGFPDVPDLLELDAPRFFESGSIRSGLIGRTLPLYRYRTSICHAVLGWPITNLRQNSFDSSLETDLGHQAARRASELKAGEDSDFEKAAFETAVERLVQRGCSVLLIAGHTHPALGMRMDPELREEMTGYLSGIEAGARGHVTVIDASQFFVPQATDFKDLVHYTKDAQARFTDGLIRYLGESPSGSGGSPRK